jgi:hypothetical protein
LKHCQKRRFLLAKKSSSQPSEPAEDMASDMAEFDQADQAARATAPNISSDAAAYRQDIAVDVFRALVHGMRIDVKHTDVPCDVAERTLKLHAELMKHAELAGIIPPVEPAE